MCITVASYSKATAKVLIFSATEAISHILLIYINNPSLSLCLSLPLCLSPFDFLSPVSHIVICRIAVWDRMQVAGASGMRIVVWDRMQVAGVSGMRIVVWDRMQVAGASGMRSLWYISWCPFPFGPYIARLPWRPDDGVGQYVRVKSMSWTASLAPAMRREACACSPCYTIRLITVGVSKAVSMPFSVSPRLAYAPTNSSRSIAAEAPKACDAAPIDSPKAMGLFTWPT